METVLGQDEDTCLQEICSVRRERGLAEFSFQSMRDVEDDIDCDSETSDVRHHLLVTKRRNLDKLGKDPAYQVNKVDA